MKKYIGLSCFLTYVTLFSADPSQNRPLFDIKEGYIAAGENIIDNANAPLVIAHRGASGHIAENTLEAFEKAIELGADMVELDVYCCASGELVVFHDKLLDDKTNGVGFIEQQPLDRLKTYLVAGEYAIPTLQEVLDCIDRQVKVDIELKGADTAKPVAKLIDHYVKSKG